jgi:hypothetical protein
LSGAVETGAHAHARWCAWAVAVEVRDDDRAAIELDHAEPPRHALAKEQLVAMPQHRFRNQITGTVLRAPIEAMREAGVAGFARRILHRCAIATDLQLEAVTGRRRGQPERDTAANARRQRRNTGPQDRVLARRPHQG